jgi:hypothetical protein
MHTCWQASLCCTATSLKRLRPCWQWLNAAGPKATVSCESHLHFDGNPFAGIGADDLPVQLRLDDPGQYSRVPKPNAPSAASCLNLFGSTDAMAFKLLL